jgi:serine/threonine-protein kinase
VPDLAPGVLVTPAIRLVRKLGAGGMGSVWIGAHLSLRTEVVVKFMADTMGANGGDRARFTREATAASQVRSPHVVQVFDHGLTQDGTPFIVMELLEGEDLGRKIARVGRMPLADVVDLIDQLALALGRVHAAQIVHRDVKPANIFVCDRGDGRPFYKLLDFGIAKGSATNMMIGSPTLTGAIVATPAYGSPEQLIGSKSVDHRSDLWSLGLVAFKALTGQLPYHGDSVASLALAIHNGPPPRLTTVVASLPAKVDDWFARACKVAAEDRFQSAQEMAKALALAAADAQPATPVMSTKQGSLGIPAADVVDDAPTRIDTTTLPLGSPTAPANPFGATKLSPGVQAPAKTALDTTWRPPGSALPRILIGAAVVALLAGGVVLITSMRHAKAAADVAAAVPPALTTTAAPVVPMPTPTPAPTPSAVPVVAAEPAPSTTASAARKPAAAPHPAPHVASAPHPTAPPVDTTPPAPAPAPTNAGKLF